MALPERIPIEDQPKKAPLTDSNNIELLTAVVRGERIAEQLKRDTLKKESIDTTVQSGVASALEDEVTKINKKDAFIDEAEGLLKELARRTNEQKNASVAGQVEEDLATAAEPEDRFKDKPPTHEELVAATEAEKARRAAERRAPDVSTPTPEKIQEIEGLLGKLRQGSKAQQVRVEQRAEKVGVLGTISKVGEWYNRRPMWQKLMFGGGLLALGVPGASVAQKVMSGVGMYATLDAVTRNRLKEHPLMRRLMIGGISTAYALLASKLFEAVGVTKTVEGMIEGWFGTAAPDTFADRFHYPTPPESAPVIPVESSELPPAVPSTLSSLEGSVQVGKGDSVWKLMEQRLSDNGNFSNLDRAQKDFVLDSYVKHLESLGTASIREFGATSGNLNIIKVGDVLNFDKVSDSSIFETFVDKAHNLTDAEKINILRART